MNYLTFAIRMNLRPGDVVITPKTAFNVVEHYLVYLGVNYLGEEVYIENDYRKGVQCINGNSFTIKTPTFKSIRRFNGDETQRYWACERAKSLLTAKYDLERFNCENFANFVQYGQSYSTQVNVAKSNFLSWVVLNVATTLQRTLS